MKKMILLFSFVAAVMAVKAQAPAGFQLGAGPRLSLATGNFGDTHSLGLGAELQAEYGFSDQVTGVATTGYSSFFGRSVILSGQSVKYKAEGYIPLLAGIRYYFSGTFFGGAQVGLGVYSYNGNSTSGFNWQPQVGYNSDKFQLVLNYSGVSKSGSTIAHFGLAGIYKFQGSKK